MWPLNQNKIPVSLYLFCCLCGRGGHTQECSQLYAECVGGGFPGVQCSRAHECSAFFLCRLYTSQHVHYLVSPSPPMPGVLSAGSQDQGFNLASSLPPSPSPPSLPLFHSKVLRCQRCRHGPPLGTVWVTRERMNDLEHTATPLGTSDTIGVDKGHPSSPVSSVSNSNKQAGSFFLLAKAHASLHRGEGTDQEPSSALQA